MSAQYLPNLSSSVLLTETTRKEAGETLEMYLGRYFKTKQIFIFENYDLGLLDHKLLENNNQVTGSQDEIAIKNVYASNNMAILNNFLVSVAHKLYIYLTNKSSKTITEDQFTRYFQDFLKKREEELFIPITE